MASIISNEVKERLKIKELEISKLNSIGLDRKKSIELANKLNVLLASYSVFYQNVRGYHWNLKGGNFFELHAKFEELYGNLYLKIDEIAERIVTLGHVANHKFSDYKTMSKIVDSNQSNNGIKSVEDVLKSLNVIISLERDVVSFASKMDDEGTKTLISDYIKGQEKLMWMYSAFLGK
jgi:starvation-inducible DNA-binding protein